MTFVHPDVRGFFAAGLLAIVVHGPCMAFALPDAAISDAAISDAAMPDVAMLDVARPDVATFLAGPVAPPVLPPGGRYAPLGDAMHIQGQPVSAWIFDTPGLIPDIADWLSARQPALRDLWVVPGAVMLGGVADGVHWVARLSDAGAGRTQGTISALRFGPDPKSGGSGFVSAPGAGHAAPAIARGGRAVSPAAGWRLNGGQLHFELRSKEGDAAIVERIWTHAAAPAALNKTVSAELAAAGWRLADTAGADSGGSGIAGSHIAGSDIAESDIVGSDIIGSRIEGSRIAGSSIAGPNRAAIRLWTRGHEMLSVVIVPLDRGSGVTAVLRIGT